MAGPDHRLRQCHDHKFDPFTTRDFYSLGAFFADIEEPIIGHREEGMVVTTPDDAKTLARLDAALAEARSRLDAVAPQSNAAQDQWEADVVRYAITLPELAADSRASDAEKAAARTVANALKKPAAARDAKESSSIRAYFLSKATTLFQPNERRVARAERERKTFFDALPKCLVSVSSQTKRTVRILPRGNWMDESGEIVKPALPHYLPRPDVEGPRADATGSGPMAGLAR